MRKWDLRISVYSQGNTESGEARTQGKEDFWLWVMFLPHIAIVSFLTPSPLPLSSWEKFYLLIPYLKLFVPWILIRLWQPVLGRQPTQYPVNSSFHYQTSYDVYQWRIPFSREELLITEAPGLQIPKRPSTCLCVSAQPSTERLRRLKVYKQDVNWGIKACVFDLPRTCGSPITWVLLLKTQVGAKPACGESCAKGTQQDARAACLLPSF